MRSLLTAQTPTASLLTALALAAALLTAGCAALDNSPDARIPPPPGEVKPRMLQRAGAHGPAARGADGWIVTVTPQELAALGFGQQMELDVQAPDVVYVVDYQRIDQLDGVFARTAGGLLPLRALLKDRHDAGRVVLRTKKKAPASQPADGDDCGA